MQKKNYTQKEKELQLQSEEIDNKEEQREIESRLERVGVQNWWKIRHHTLGKIFFNFERLQASF